LYEKAEEDGQPEHGVDGAGEAFEDAGHTSAPTREPKGRDEDQREETGREGEGRPIPPDRIGREAARQDETADGEPEDHDDRCGVVQLPVEAGRRRRHPRWIPVPGVLGEDPIDDESDSDDCPRDRKGEAGSCAFEETAPTERREDHEHAEQGEVLPLERAPRSEAERADWL
jgi:hypothetical protein